jgi:hypothetical protein
LRSADLSEGPTRRKERFVPVGLHDRAGVARKLVRQILAVARRDDQGAARRRHGNVVLSCGVRNHAGTRGLPGGGRRPAKPVSEGLFSQ